MKQIHKSLAIMMVAIAFITLGFIFALIFVPQLTNQVVGAIDDTPAPNIASSDVLNAQERVFGDIYDSVSRSVVSIVISVDLGNGFEPYSTGSGFVIDALGHIVTNYHVVANGGEGRIEVSMYDGTIALAEIVGEDPHSDIAVIQVYNIPVDRLHPVTFADSNQLRVGQTVLALGNPFQNDWTLTSGIISALDRRIFGLARNSIGGVIQTDAAINPGNSGGPLLNLRGEIIGVNSQIDSQTRSNSGIGFAVPSNLVQKVATRLIETGSMEYSFMGISYYEIDLDLINRYNLPNNIRGVAIDDVVPNTPAEAAGLRSDGSTIDIITAINGKPVTNFDEMIGYLAINTDPGDTVLLTVYRNGEIIELTVTLTAR